MNKDEKEKFIFRCSKLRLHIEDLIAVEDRDEIWVCVLCTFLSDICEFQEDKQEAREGIFNYLKQCFEENEKFSNRKMDIFENPSYHYTECGLSNVYLVNGFNVIETPEGKAVSVNDVEELHKALGLDSKEKMPSISSSWKIKFLDKKIYAMYQIT